MDSKTSNNREIEVSCVGFDHSSSVTKPVKQLVIICTSILIALSILAGCANYAYAPQHEPKSKPRHHVSHKASKVIHPKSEPTPNFQTYGHSYIVNPDGSWHWLEDPTPTPAPAAGLKPKQQSF